MSTRCTIHFERPADKKPTAIIYRHCDGYPNGEHGVPADLERFFIEVKKQTNDTRFNNPSYLAAKYVVWQAGENAHNGKPLDFLSVGVLMRDPGDIEYRYHVICDGKPTVKWEEAS